MGETTPDIRQLSTCCGEPLVWNQNNPGGWTAVCPRCEEQRFWSRPADGRPCRKLTATEELLVARIAELEATLANERGEGEAPCEGWEWWRSERAWALCKDGCGFHVTRTAKGWTWDGDRVSSGQPHFDTARAAMRAASGAP